MKVLNLLATSATILLANVTAITPPTAPLTAEVLAEAMAEMVTDEQLWRFQVYVDEKPVGLHEFRLQQHGEQQLLNSVAEFEYKLMFVTLYNYQHRNQEVWQDGCLASIDSNTDANGKDYAVSGEKSGDGFRVEGKKGSEVLPACVMSFAYWNPQFLQAGRLLNTQNGEYLEVAVSEPANDSLQVQGKQMRAQRYELTAEKLELALWYSEEGAWLGLESSYENGRTLRYELLSTPVTPQQRSAGL